MLQESLGGFLFQVLVLGQPLFWMWLYETEFVQIKERFRGNFYIISLCVLTLIYESGFSVGFYTTSLLIQYTAFTVFSVYIFNLRYNIKQALCLGFLTVFLNSYYWEMPLHLAEVLSGSIHAGMIVQLWRLVPLLFFFKHYRFTKYDRATLSLGLGFSTIIMALRYGLHISGVILYPVNRFVCLCLLLKVLIEAVLKEYINEDADIKVIV